MFLLQKTTKERFKENIIDNKELDAILASKFNSLKDPVSVNSESSGASSDASSGASLVPDTMARIAAGADSELEATSKAGSHDWVLAFAGLLGALVCVPSLQAIDVQGVLNLIPLELFGSYAQTIASLALPLLGLLVMLPIAWLVIED